MCLGKEREYNMLCRYWMTEGMKPVMRTVISRSEYLYIHENDKDNIINYVTINIVTRQKKKRKKKLYSVNR